MLLVTAAVPLALMLLQPAAHGGATIIVNNATDPASTSGNGFCTLREAINNANAKTDTSGGDCNPGTGNDTIAIFVLSGTIAVGSALPAIQNTLTISGPGSFVPINGGAAGFTIFTIKSGATVLMENLAIENVDSMGSFSGGGIVNSGTLTLINCAIEFTLAAHGGAVANEVGTLNVGNSLFVHNDSVFQGGAISNDSGVVSISNSTFVDDLSTSVGGAIYNGQNQLLGVGNSTFSNNFSTAGGASLYNDSGGVLNVNSSILAGAIGGGECAVANPANPISDIGYNLSDDFSCGFGNTNGGGANGQTIGDGQDARLDSSGLQNNGGPTETIGLRATSPAIDAIPTGSGLCLATDQRGFARPDSGESGTPACDVGAFESSEPSATPTPTSTPTATATPTRTATVTATATPTVTPVPVNLKISPRKLSFGTVAQNASSKAKIINVANPKGKKKHVGITVMFEGAGASADYIVSNGDCGRMLTPGQECDLSIVFHPLGTGPRNATLMIMDNANGAPQRVPLTGTGK
jgi:hypothetical protein